MFNVGRETGVNPVSVTGLDDWSTNNHSSGNVCYVEHVKQQRLCLDVKEKKKTDLTAKMDTKEGLHSDNL